MTHIIGNRSVTNERPDRFYLVRHPHGGGNHVTGRTDGYRTPEEAQESLARIRRTGYITQLDTVTLWLGHPAYRTSKLEGEL